MCVNIIFVRLQMNSNFEAKNKGLGLLGDAMSLTRLHEAAEAAKVELSKGQSTSTNLPCITADQTGPEVRLWRGQVAVSCTAK